VVYRTLICNLLNKSEVLIESSIHLFKKFLLSVIFFETGIELALKLLFEFTTLKYEDLGDYFFDLLTLA